MLTAVSGMNPQLWPSAPTPEKSLHWPREGRGDGHLGGYLFTVKMSSSDGSNIGNLMMVIF